MRPTRPMAWRSILWTSWLASRIVGVPSRIHGGERGAGLPCRRADAPGARPAHITVLGLTLTRESAALAVPRRRTWVLSDPTFAAPERGADSPSRGSGLGIAEHYLPATELLGPRQELARAGSLVATGRSRLPRSLEFDHLRFGRRHVRGSASQRCGSDRGLRISE